jgi:hypothetical protein
MLEFAAPALLTALVTLPALWWLLRLLPPKPRREVFPALKLLLKLKKPPETPKNTPWWLILLRLGLAGALIFALAGPLFNQLIFKTSNEPLIMVIDSGVNAAKNWDKITKKANEFIDRAENGVIIAPTSDVPSQLLTPQEARERLAALTPASYIPDRLPIKGNTIYLSDGIAGKNDAAFAATMKTIVTGLPPFATLHEVTADAKGLTINTTGEGRLVAKDAKGLTLAEVPIKPVTQLDLPQDVRNQVARLDIVGERHAGAVHLIDRRLRKKAATVISGAANDAQSLLSPAYYLERALQPFTERRIVEGKSPSESVLIAINDAIPMIILTDVGALTSEATNALSDYIDKGGMLIRFAGNRLAASQDRLTPVKLRSEVRQMGGALSWDKPKTLAAFPVKSPFAGLIIPQDVSVSRQVLAEPDGFLTDKTYAALDDGTPMVTGETRGRGMLVLFHVSANAAWSNLALSGLFPQMMERLVQLAGTTERVSEAEIAAPLQILDGFGGFIPPDLTVKAIETPPLAASKDHPAGLYGLAESPLAVNVYAKDYRLKPLDKSLFSSTFLSYNDENAVDFRPWLLMLALALFALDSAIVLKMGGYLRKIAFVFALFLITPVDAQDTRLAFVKTGKASVDRLSEAGLNGLSRFIAMRTTLEPGLAKGVDFEKDDLALSPVIYWPVSPETRLSAKAKIALETYLKNGGLLILDTQDAHITGQTPYLRNLLVSLDLPELTPIPKDHVVTRSYYLLDQFVGRHTNGQTWVESLNTLPDDERPAKASDSVSPIIITSNDFAAAWAIDERGQPLVPIDAMPRQREMAYRAGVNIIFYALTGNYKADQIHAPALLERLGRRK